ncbi:MAG TPA: hypothetical protein VIM58_07150, partial [Candidatus Methylacidiphilales bacterium]
IYTPLAPADAVPQPMLPGLSTNLATIVKISTNGVPFFTTTSKSALVSNLASSVSTLASSVNVRGVSVARWNAPRLTSSTNRFPVPDWVFVTRDGPLFLPAGTSPRAAGLGSPAGGGILGRYAYVVYDTSGLLDANAGGFPTAANSGASVKGLMPWADLTQLAAGTLTTNDMNSLALWRNASHAGDYAAYVTTNWSLNGFMRVAPGDTAFLSRQELIAYAEKQNPHLSNALPYLTTFSRELDAPSWGPLTNVQSAGPYAYLANANISGSTNRFVPNVRVLVPFTRRDGTKASVGEPLVKYRFPLSKLSLLAKTVGQPNALSTPDKAAIKSYFGLVPDSSSSGYYRKWIYTNPTGTGAAASILTLDTVAGLKREPDFFELLQAGILAGSLGKSGRNDDGPASGTLVDTDATPSYQIIRIGANIIDQWHTDNYPTTIFFNGYDCYGTADLPYINQMFAKVWNPNGQNIPSATSSQPLVYYLYPQMWNPHQSPANAYASTPTSFRLAFATNDCWYTQLIINSAVGARSRWGWLPAGNTSGSWVGNPPTTYFTANANAAYYPPLQFTNGSIQTAFREPGFVTNSMVTSTNVLNDAAGLGSTIVGGWKVATVSVPLSTNTPPLMDNSTTSPATWGAQSPQPYGWNTKWFLSLQMQLQYLDASGNYRTYATFVGSPSTTTSSVTGVSVQAFCGGPTNTATLAGSAFLKSDPRTSRFGACMFLQGLYGTGGTVNCTNNNATAGLVSSPTSIYGYSTSYYPKFFPGGYFRPDVLAINDTSVPLQGAFTTSASYADPDGITRFGDGRQAYPNGYSPFYTNSVSATSGTMVRPVILHRPFVSVAEMGYAFRDAPWKTLDFCSTNSADGGLLDLFSLNDEAPLSAYGAPVAAGRVNPNTPYPQVLAALLAGQQSNPFPGTAPISASGAWTEAKAIVASTSNQPVLSRADLALRIASLLGNGIPSSTGIKVDQEAPIRALAGVANVRTWNLLIDLIAQSGKYPPTATDLSQFTVEGERRYWLHIAIDRYTGKIVDQQIEIVSQ